MDNFYKSFEDKFRGGRELILNRLRVYQPFLEAMRALYPEAKALDLGCGRGEWLQILQEAGIEASGIDLDEGMVKEAQRLGFKATLGDAIEHLQGVPESSLEIISGFHIIEHIPFEALHTLIKESKRALKPAGLLILETPNAENPQVGSHYFYLDPTHRRPLPHPLLQFMTDYHGFHRSKLLRLQESPHLHDPSAFIGLSGVFGGASADYAIVAQKASSAETLHSFDPCFSQEYGISLENLLHRFDAQLAHIYESAQKTIDRINQERLQAENERDLMLKSRSWKLTAPLRWINARLHHLRQRPNP